MAISRFGSLLDGVRQGYLGDPEASQVIEETLRSGQSWNPQLEHFPNWFTTAFFHHPAELTAEVIESRFTFESIIGIEGPGGFVGDGGTARSNARTSFAWPGWSRQEASLLGLSPHLLAVARKSR